MGFRYQACEFCGRYFKTDLDHARYCSDNCRQAGYRRRVNPASGSPASIAARNQRGALTRMATSVQFECQQCGKLSYRTAAEGNRRYCSDACKQKAWRERRKADRPE
jgi:endogenous inhibitor of DNA gyrase (YacG/DUF329 family)